MSDNIPLQMLIIAILGIVLWAALDEENEARENEADLKACMAKARERHYQCLYNEKPRELCDELLETEKSGCAEDNPKPNKATP